jgi:hypothetical protein
LPSIEEEVQDLSTDVVLDKKTRSGKTAVSTQVAPEQPPVAKKKRKTMVRKIKESVYVTEEVEGIEAAADLVRGEEKEG